MQSTYTGPTGRFSRIDLYDPVVRWTLREKTFKTALLRQANLHPGLRLLDLGSGTGTLALLAHDFTPGVQVVALDADSLALALAQRKLSRLPRGPELIRGLAQMLPFADESFDRVLSTLLFHHLTSDGKQRALQEVHRVLRRGGEFHLADFGKPGNWVMRVAFTAVRWVDGAETTRENLLGRLPDLLEQAGFAQVEETRRVDTLFGTLRLYRASKQG